MGILGDVVALGRQAKATHAAGGFASRTGVTRATKVNQTLHGILPGSIGSRLGQTPTEDAAAAVRNVAAKARDVLNDL